MAERVKGKVEKLLVRFSWPSLVTTWSEKLDQDITTGVQGLNEIYTFMSAVHEEQVERVRKDHLALEKRALREKFTNIYTKQLKVTKTYHY